MIECVLYWSLYFATYSTAVYAVTVSIQSVAQHVTADVCFAISFLLHIMVVLVVPKTADSLISFLATLMWLCFPVTWQNCVVLQWRRWHHVTNCIHSNASWATFAFVTCIQFMVRFGGKHCTFSIFILIWKLNWSTSFSRYLFMASL